jgi:hypothetical protein
MGRAASYVRCWPTTSSFVVEERESSLKVCEENIHTVRHVASSRIYNANNNKYAKRKGTFLFLHGGVTTTTAATVGPLHDGLAKVGRNRAHARGGAVERLPSVLVHLRRDDFLKPGAAVKRG